MSAGGRRSRGDNMEESPSSRGSPFGDSINWRERCLHLEDSLNRFRQQAGKIRSALGQKKLMQSIVEEATSVSEHSNSLHIGEMKQREMSELEGKLQASEQRAEVAEQQLELMERQLAAMNWQPGKLEQRVQELEQCVQDRDRALRDLEMQLEDQKMQRLHDARQVEEKAQRIKDWVTCKLQELESQNSLLVRENGELQDQVLTLRQRLLSLPANAAKEIYRLSLQEGIKSRPLSQSSDPPDIRDSMMESVHEDNSGEQKESSPDNTDNQIDTISDIESEESIGEMNHELYQEIDANHESIYELKPLGPPQIRIERKLFNGRLLDSLISSSNGSEEMIDRARISWPRMQENEQLDNCCDGDLIIAEDITPINLTPRSVGTTFSFQPNAPPSTPTNFINMNFDTKSVTSPATLPRVKDKGKPSPLKLVKSDNVETSLLSRRQLLSGEIQVHHFSSEPREVGTTSSSFSGIKIGVRFSSEERTLPTGSDPGGQCSIKGVDGKDEPTIGSSIIKSPASEKRAYAVAHKRSKGWKKAKGDHQSTTTGSSSHLQPSIGHLFQEVNAPVYATLKGKAAQIRNTPFMEESSSDSSDDDDELIVITNTLTAVDNKTTSDRPASNSSCDYALPPEDVSSKSDSDTSEPEQKLLKFAADSQKHDTLEKCGYLSKLSGKVKTWRRRFFVLRNGELFIYKSQHDVFKKPQGSIVLDGQTKIIKSATELSFEITNCKKTYYLTADSPAELERWIRVLQRVLRRQATGNLLDSVDSKAVVKGWITKVKNGVTRRCWCVLLGRHFLYYKSPGDKTPIGQLNLQDAKLEEIEGACDSDDESDVSVPPIHVFAIWPPCQAPTYLVIPTRQEKDSWLYHLTVAAGGGTGAVGTDYEQFIAKLMHVNADPNSSLWKLPLMLYTKDAIREPLTTLPSEELQQKAVELFKSLHQFMMVTIESQSLEFHVHLAQSMLGLCLEHTELQNELYCQVIKQTSRHPAQPKTAVQSLLLCGKHSWFLCDGSPTSPTSSVVDLTDSKLNPLPHVLTQGWQLMSLAVSHFMPKQTITWLLKVHLHRHSDPRSEIGKYAIYCQRALERTSLKGPREVGPSRMEVMSMLLRNPYHHSLPISIPVHFLNDTYQVVSFDGSMTVQEFVQSLNKSIGVRDMGQSGFALFADHPAGEVLEHCLEPQLKVCDIISKWEQIYCANVSAFINDKSRTIRLLYKNRLYFKRNSRQETEKEKLLLAYQVNDEIVHGRFPLNRDLALELASLMMQVEYGDLRIPDGQHLATNVSPGSTPSPASNAALPLCGLHTQQLLGAALQRFYPAKFLERSPDGPRQLQERLFERWRSLRGRSAADCVRVYLAVARKWQFFGATIYCAKMLATPNEEDVWLAVQEDGVSVLDFISMQPMALYDYKSLMTFGGWRDDFMLVVTQLIESAPHHYEHRTEKFLFAMAKCKVNEVTQLIASYINAKLQQPSPEAATSE